MEEWPCPHCNEPLLGAANRCWKCGGRVRQPSPKVVTSAATSGPLTARELLDTVILATVAEGEDTDVLVATTAESVALAMLTRQEVSLALAKEPPRRGSPFAAEVPLSQRVPHETVYGQGPYKPVAPTGGFGAPDYPVLAAQYPKHSAAIGGVVASLVLGVAGLCALFFTVFGALLAMPGAIAGIWGLQSNRRNLAILGILLCCLAMAIGGYRAGFALYEWANPTTTTNTVGSGF